MITKSEISNKLMDLQEFELLYLKFKSEYYMNMATEDLARIDRLEKQL